MEGSSIKAKSSSPVAIVVVVVSVVTGHWLGEKAKLLCNTWEAITTIIASCKYAAAAVHPHSEEKK